MAVLTNTLRIWSHVRQIGPLSLGTAANPSQDAWFALNLAPVFVNEATGVDVTPDEDLTKSYPFLHLWPWRWEWTELRVALISAGVVQSLITVPAGNVLREARLQKLDDALFAEWMAVLTPRPGQAPPETVAQRFGQACGRESNPVAHAPATMDQDTVRDWKTFLFHASSYPGDLALRAKLAAFFHIPYAQLGNADEIVVAPIFASAPFQAPRAPQDLPPVPPPPPPPAPAPPPPCVNLSTAAWGACPLVRWKTDLSGPPAAGDPFVTTWSYAPAAGELNTVWIQPPLPLRIPNSPSWGQWQYFENFIHEDTLWIQPPSAPGSAPDQSEEWHDHLENRLQGVFDLPLRLIEWAHDAEQSAQAADPPSHATIDARFGAAFLASLRDVVQGGLLTRPDGSSLVRDVARLLGPANAAAAQTAMTNFAATYSSLENWRARLNQELAAQAKNFDLKNVAGTWEAAPPAGGDPQAYLSMLGKVRSALLDNNILCTFILNEWSAALAAAGLSALWTSDTIAKVSAYLGSIDLAATLRLGFLGAAWSKQTGAWYDPANIAQPQNLPAALLHVYRERFALAPAPAPWGYQALQPRADGATSSTQAAIEDYLGRFVQQWAASATGPTPSGDQLPDYSRGNQGIRVQFAQYAAQADAAGDEFLGNLRGACFLLRLVSNPGEPDVPWSVLNLGQLAVRGESVDASGLPAQPAFDAERVAVAPWQIAYRNGQRQVSGTFRNDPLAARSPASQLSQVQTLKPVDSADRTPANALFELWNPYRAPGYQLPRLVFGRTYQAAAFAVGLAGELPLEVCDPLRPWRVGPDPLQWKVPPQILGPDIPYLRTVPVGLVRMEGPNPRQPNQEMAELAVPPIPEGVYPIARSIQTIDPASPTGDQQKDPLILLNDGSAVWSDPTQDHADFAFRPPATDLATWESCQPSTTDAAIRRQRADVRSFLAQNSDLPNDGDKKDGPSLLLDDPLVSGFDVTLTCVWSPPGQPKPPAIPKNFAVRRPAGTLLQQSQSAAVALHIIRGSQDLKVPEAATDPYEVTVRVPNVLAGFVYRLDIAPSIADADKTKFDSRLTKKGLVEPRTIYIEVATPLPVDTTSPALLSKALALPTGPDKPLAVGLSLSGLGALGPWIHRVELMIQRWRWQGRPLARLDGANTAYTFPFEQMSESDLEPLDGLYFGERDSNDHLIVTAQADALQPSGGDPVLYTYDLGATPQSVYYRFAARAYSRYEGLMRNPASVDSRGITSGIAPSTVAEQWRRWVSLCKRASPAPPPAVRLVIPLTHAQPGEAAPSLLVVLDEPWYDWAGLAEEFQASLVSVTPGDGSAALLELGADPVISNPAPSTPLPAPANPDPATMEAAADWKLEGPVGYTFDTDTSAPLFDRASFVLPAPVVPGQNDLSWWFLELQFRRTLNVGGTLNPSPALNSPWTKPVQVQVLPAANLWKVGTTREDSQTFTCKFNKAGVSLWFNGAEITDAMIVDVPAAGSTNAFELWLLLTIQVDDVFGRVNQEAFVDLIPWGSRAAYTGANGVPDLVRLVEVQRMTKASATKPDSSDPKGRWKALAQDLFPAIAAVPSTPPPTGDSAMAKARVVRMSPPIPALLVG